MRKDITAREVAVVAPLIVADPVPRLLPEAGHRRHQPGRQGHADARSAPATRPRPRRYGRRQVNLVHAGARRRDLRAAAPGLQGAAADADPVRRRDRRRARRGVRAARIAASWPSSCVALVGAGRRARVRDRRRRDRVHRDQPRHDHRRPARSRSTVRRCSCRARCSCWASSRCCWSPSGRWSAAAPFVASRRGHRRHRGGPGAGRQASPAAPTCSR